MAREPASAEASCGPGAYPSGPGYVFSDITIGSGDPGWSEVSFIAHWSNGVDPSWRECTLRVTLDDGQSLDQVFGLSVPDNTPQDRSVPRRGLEYRVIDHYLLGGQVTARRPMSDRKDRTMTGGLAPTDAHMPNPALTVPGPACGWLLCSGSMGPISSITGG